MSFVEALRSARRLLSEGAKSFELRAATSLARLWQRQGSRRRSARVARAHLRLVCRGFDTLDLIEAKALLAELG
jgi:hypothetical protein